MTGWETVSLETLLAAGYAAFLAIVAIALEVFAHLTQRRSSYGKMKELLNRSRTPNFPFSEIAQFQRGLSLALLVLAGFILAVEMFRHHGSSDLAILSAGLLPPLVVGRRILTKFYLGSD